MLRLGFGALGTVVFCVLPALPAYAQSFPSQTVRIVVPYAAGGSTDTLGRALAKELSTGWGQPVVVENISGADSIIGTSRVVTAAPDGHTLLLTIDPTVVGNRFLLKKLPYD
ncbi:MAG: tripartite tricarboxylate transporter substrate binding protein, partial [Betaproteobacteria bacterium]|nr:tripartite tricarboxylate transporter substrate binding protein [Betaproteobacteria bacterium]